MNCYFYTLLYSYVSLEPLRSLSSDQRLNTNISNVTQKPEASSSMGALQRVLVNVIITLLNDSERSLSKIAALSNKQIKSPISWKSKQNTFQPSV